MIWRGVFKMKILQKIVSLFSFLCMLILFKNQNTAVAVILLVLCAINIGLILAMYKK